MPTPTRENPRVGAHRLQDAGVRTTSVGKLHYRNAEVPAGFDEQIIPPASCPKGGVGDIHSAVRDEKGPASQEQSGVDGRAHRAGRLQVHRL